MLDNLTDAAKKRLFVACFIALAVSVETVVYIGAAALFSRQKAGALPGVHTGL